MITWHKWETYKADYDDPRIGGYCNIPHVLKITFNRKSYETILPSGESDYISLYREGGYFYLLSDNPRHGYCGLNEYKLNEDHTLIETGSVFFQNSQDFEMGMDRFFSYSDMHKVKLLLEYLPY